MSRRGFAPVLGALLLLAALLSPAAAEQRAHGQGRLFKVTAAGVEPSYVFGTMHATDPDVLDLPPPVAKAFGASTRVVLELVFTPEVEMRLAGAMRLSEGRRLSEIIGPELYAKLLRRADVYGIPPEETNRLRPWAASLVFSIPVDELNRSASGALPLDRALQQAADQRGTPVTGLETLDEQIAAFSDLSERDQIATLRLAIALNPEIDSLFAEMKRAYLAGDLDKLHAMSLSMFSGQDAHLAELFEKRVIELRNRRMANRMARHVKQGGAFVAIGALHLSGDSGVLRLLEKRGYTIKRAH